MAEKLTDIELTGIQLQDTKPRTLAQTSSMILQEDDVETGHGTLHVSVQGDRHKPAILTYHDIGLNHHSQFEAFFNYSEMQPILRHFCVYHVNAPGQHEGAVPLTQRQDEGMPRPPVGEDSDRAILTEHESNLLADSGPHSPLIDTDPRFHYPAMDELAEILLPVLQFYGLKRVIGFGVGAGANVLSRFALAHPEKVDGLVLINCTAGQAGWTEWGYQKMNLWYLRSGQLTGFTVDYLLWHWFGNNTANENHDLVVCYKDNMSKINPHNLALFIDSYIKRTDLHITRELDPLKKKSTKMIKCPVLLIAGHNSPHLDDTVRMNGRLDPTNSTWLQISDCGGMPLEEQPEKVCEAFRLFIQGMGYVPSLSQTKIVASRSKASRSQMIGHSGPAYA